MRSDGKMRPWLHGWLLLLMLRSRWLSREIVIRWLGCGNWSVGRSWGFLFRERGCFGMVSPGHAFCVGEWSCGWLGRFHGWC